MIVTHQATLLRTLLLLTSMMTPNFHPMMMMIPKRVTTTITKKQMRPTTDQAVGNIVLSRNNIPWTIVDEDTVLPGRCTEQTFFNQLLALRYILIINKFEKILSPILSISFSATVCATNMFWFLFLYRMILIILHALQIWWRQFLLKTIDKGDVRKVKIIRRLILLKWSPLLAYWFCEACTGQLANL